MLSISQKEIPMTILDSRATDNAVSVFGRSGSSAVGIIFHATERFPRNWEEEEIRSQHNRTGGIIVPLMLQATVHAKTSADSNNVVQEIKELSGLTAEQVGKIFGVSRRSVQNWIRGNKMSAANAEYAALVLAQLKAIPAENPMQRREKILRVDVEDGFTKPSLFELFVRNRPKAQLLQYPAKTAVESLGQ